MYKLTLKYGHFSTVTEPWNIPFEKRMKDITEAHLQKKKTVAYLYETPDSSTFRYRAYNMCQSLENSERWGASFFFADDIDKLSKHIDSIDVVIVVRFRWTEVLDRFLKGCKARNIKTAFDVDDMVFDTKYMPLFLNTLGVNTSDEHVCNHCFAYFSRLGMTGDMCNYTLCTNAYLSDKLKKRFRKPSFIIPNFMNKEQLEPSSKLREEKREKGFTKPFTIGYFSGSDTHRHDLDMVAAELVKLMKECPDIVLKVVGYMDIPQLFSKHINSERIISMKFMDFRELQKAIAAVDVNIVPLLDNDFTNCKSELKFFEAAVVDTVTCASPVHTYRDAVKNGKNGYLCSQGQWYDVIKQMHKRGIRSSVIDNGRKYALDNYSPEKWTKEIEKTLNTISRGERLEVNEAK